SRIRYAVTTTTRRRLLAAQLFRITRTHRSAPGRGRTERWRCGQTSATACVQTPVAPLIPVASVRSATFFLESGLLNSGLRRPRNADSTPLDVNDVRPFFTGTRLARGACRFTDSFRGSTMTLGSGISLGKVTTVAAEIAGAGKRACPTPRR